MKMCCRDCGEVSDLPPSIARERLSYCPEDSTSRRRHCERLTCDSLLSKAVARNIVVQRQEHGRQKRGTPLTREDGRPVIFQTLVLMFEIDRSPAWDQPRGHLGVLQ
jgi:hypothetical protein